jgi:trans-aconitate 2-methyltransferase
VTTSGTWDPALYSQFGDERLRPGLDLLARIPASDPAVVHDAGCGNGTLTRLLAARWPDALVVGSDTSTEMLAEAAAQPGRIRWIEMDIARFASEEPPDVIFYNAVLHWLPDHATVVRRLFSSLAPGGTLAFQVPLSWWEPSHVAMRRCLDELPPDTVHRDALIARHATPPVEEPEFYRDLLAAESAATVVWETRYHHALEGEDPVFRWVSGTTLIPVVDALGARSLEAFTASYRKALTAAYPRRPDGTTSFPFPRLFVVATKVSSAS